MLSRYDEYPVHQSSRPFAHTPSTDLSWDEGYYFGVYSPDEQVYMMTGMRVNPNADIIGGYVIINIAGRQYSLRLSRCWRRQMDTVIGPLRFEFIEPLKTIRLVLEPNDSALAFDLIWTGTAPAFEEAHHQAETRGRVTTDQTRYSQPGVSTGVVQFEGKSYRVTPETWGGDRDHSWGLYADRKPLGGHREWLPPRVMEGVPRAMHIWTLFNAGPWSGFYLLHESATGESVMMNDTFGTPFEGRLCREWDQEVVHLVAGSHEMRFQPGTRIFTDASIDLTDDKGLTWTQRFEVASPPLVPQTSGYTMGSWKDGGSIHTYHGSEELALEWDDFDFSRQPFDYQPYPPKHGTGTTAAQTSADFGLTSAGDQIHGVEFVCRTELIEPDGTKHPGIAHMENFIFGRYEPYGFE